MTIKSKSYNSHFFKPINTQFNSSAEHQFTESIRKKIEIDCVLKLRGYLIILNKLCTRVLAKHYANIFTKDLFTEKDIFIQQRYEDFKEFSDLIHKVFKNPCKSEVNNAIDQFRAIQSHPYIREMFTAYPYSLYRQSFSYYSIYNNNQLDPIDIQTRDTIFYISEFMTVNLSNFPSNKSNNFYDAKHQNVIKPPMDFEKTKAINLYTATYLSLVEEKKEAKSVVTTTLQKLSAWNPFKKPKSTEIDPTEYIFANRKKLMPL